MKSCIKQNRKHSERGSIAVELLLLIPVYCIILGFGLGCIDVGSTACKHGMFSYAFMSLYSNRQSNASEISGKYIFGDRQTKKAEGQASSLIDTSTWLLKNSFWSSVTSTEESVISNLMHFGKTSSSQKHEVTFHSLRLSNYARRSAGNRRCEYTSRTGAVPVEKGGKYENDNPYTLQNVSTEYQTWLDNKYSSFGGYLGYCKYLSNLWAAYGVIDAADILQNAQNLYLSTHDNSKGEYTSWCNAEYQRINAGYFQWEAEHQQQEETPSTTLYDQEENLEQNPYQYQEIGQNPYKYQNVGTNPYTYQNLTSLSDYNGYSSWLAYRSLAMAQENWAVVIECNFTLANIQTAYDTYKAGVEENNRNYAAMENNLQNIRNNNSAYAQWEAEAKLKADENLKYSTWETEHSTRENDNTIELLKEMSVAVPNLDNMNSGQYVFQASGNAAMKLLY